MLTEDEKQKLIKMGVISLEKETSVSIFVRVCEALQRQNFDLKRFTYTKQVEAGKGKKQTVNKTLEDIQQEYPEIDIERIIEETGVELEYSIGLKKRVAIAAINGNGEHCITEDEKQKLIKMGVISLEKETSMSIFVKVCEALQRQGFNFREFNFSKQVKIEKGKTKQGRKTLEDIQEEYPEIDIERIIEETGVDLKYSIGNSKNQATTAARGNKTTTTITEEEKNKLICMGVISLEEETSMSIFVRVCEALQRQNFDFGKFIYTKQIEADNGEKQTVNKTLEDMQQEYPEIDIERIIEETGVDLKYSIGNSKTRATNVVRGGKQTTIITEDEKQKLINMGVISLERETSMSIFVRVCEALQRQGFDFKEFSFSRKIKMENGKTKQVAKTLEDIKQEYPEIDVERIIEETGVDFKYSIGASKNQATAAARGNKTTTTITEEEKNKLICMGVISLESKLAKAKQQRDKAKEKKKEAKKLEAQVESQLKKRGKIHEE